MLITPTPPGVGLISEPSSGPPLCHTAAVPLATVRLSEVPWAILCHPWGCWQDAEAIPLPRVLPGRGSTASPVPDSLHLPRAAGAGPRSRGCLEELDQPTPHRDRLIPELLSEIVCFIDPD